MAKAVQQEFDFDTEFLGAQAVEEEIGYGVTVGEDKNILKFIKTDKNGTYIRDHGKWSAIDPEASEEENPDVFDKPWYAVSNSFLLYFDVYSAKKDAISLVEIQDFLIL